MLKKCILLSTLVLGIASLGILLANNFCLLSSIPYMPW
ncbi:hypothetical protein CLROS_030540 [Clostridium felsineum]|uniref:Uncharacterized protein n=1 Tax=Clostridium felsineum TaxID=36839 RepID=A0A1S8KZP3_9CLOT|nr:hypothetical protein CLAUR_041230 [Clostridium felsineum]URZ07693.1 hypothetical protein CLROS_030540 [Clostridium felsineum]URZ12724.1 hypothetical protein CROST_034690 [Clostridium felsineum]URZ15368.1 hypothetical protein CLFE_013860 [Clostridium felsineum DSM 794]